MSSTYVRAFKPLGNNKTVNVAVTAAAVSLTVPDQPYGTRAIRCVNSGTDTIFIEIVDRLSINPTTTTSMPMIPNSVEVFTLDMNAVGIRAIGAAGGNTLYVTYGEGL